MPLAEGVRVGPYEVLSLLGAGGMGEVWRALDPRIDREVALKTLPEAMASDPERMARFQREARVLAGLNHTNIALLYGLEQLPLPPSAERDVGEAESSGAWVLVMELVEGEGLDERIARGPIPVDEAIPIALQVADALAAAHDQGVVHRDLKPANIKVRPDGTVKVLDFGLATTWQPPAAHSDPSLSPTITSHHTELGRIMGTANYMSPEQARGRPVDRRADIWGFGCLLFEMLTARKAFAGDTVSDTVAAILKDEPGWERLPADLDPVARHVLRRCLAKDPARRFHDIVDVRIELEEDREVVPDARTKRVSRRNAVGWGLGLAAVAGCLAAAAILLSSRLPPGQSPTYRALSFRSGHVASARFAPDGETVIYAIATRDRPLTLLSTRSDSIESTALDLPSADVLGISRNGKMALLLDVHREGTWVRVGTLAAADLAGGAPRPILERVNDGDISADGTRMAVVHEVGHSQRLEYPLGRVLFETHGWISHVRIAPDGERVAFLHHPFYGDDRGFAVLVDGDGKVTRLSGDISDSLQGLAWSPHGDSIWFSAFVFGKGGVVWSVEPGSTPRELLRSPVAVRIQDVASDGRALLVAGDSRAEIAGLLAGQTRERRYEGWNDDSIGGLAADGSVFAGNEQASNVDGEYTVFVRHADGSAPVRIGLGDVIGMSPDGAWVFTQRLTGDRSKLTLLPTGPGLPRTIDLGGVTAVGSASGPLTCSLDGQRAAFIGMAGGLGPRIYVLDVRGGTVRPIGPVGTRGAVISPDGSRVASIGPEGVVTIYPVAGGQPREVPGIEPGEEPRQWSLDGRSLLVWDRTFPARIHRVRVDDGARELALEIMPGDPTGVLYGDILLAPGGEHYLYRYRRDLSTLFLVHRVP